MMTDNNITQILKNHTLLKCGQINLQGQIYLEVDDKSGICGCHCAAGCYSRFLSASIQAKATQLDLSMFLRLINLNV